MNIHAHYEYETVHIRIIKNVVVYFSISTFSLVTQMTPNGQLEKIRKKQRRI